MKAKSRRNPTTNESIDTEWKTQFSGCKKLVHELPITLERVVGMGVTSNHSISINQLTGEIAYPVGSIICIYKAKENRQWAFLFNENNKNYRWVSYSEDGTLLAAGEDVTKQPEITIWQFNEIEEKYELYCKLTGHKLWVESLYFSPNGKHLVSLGNKNDKGLIVWDLSTK